MTSIVNNEEAGISCRASLAAAMSFVARPSRIEYDWDLSAEDSLHGGKAMLSLPRLTRKGLGTKM
jgi:hypothetical protein